MCAQVHLWVSANLFLLFSHCAKRSFLFHTTAMASIPVHSKGTKRKGEQSDMERERNQNVTVKMLPKGLSCSIRQPWPPSLCIGEQKRKGEQGDRERERNQNVARVCMETDDLSRCIRLRRFESNEPMQVSSLALAGRMLSTHVPANASISFL